ncbi:beta-1 adrenergic receptor-like [Stylophora pistillata]|uniref:beta-1 adrenergic receptor-like n=1 Tax=Stylophora pistillata TaxID=50429 RepID=UPI000C042470|nr:beta-1 adrenergic receptor-like [Stylophora pistillata]
MHLLSVVRIPYYVTGLYGICVTDEFKGSISLQPISFKFDIWFEQIQAKFLWIHTTVTTTFNICCVSIDRFIAIRFPFRYQDIVTKKRCYTVIILVWLFSLGLPFSMLSVHGEQSINVSVLWISVAFITFAFPILVVLCSYIFIFKSAKKQFKRTLAGENSPIFKNDFRVRFMKNFKALKTIGFFLGACIISWMPSFVVLSVDCYYTVINDWDKTDILYYIVWPWVEAIAFTSSAINPFIYYFRNKDFRRAFRRTSEFCRLPCGRSKENTRTTGLRSTGNPMARKDLRRPGNVVTRETEL